MRVEQLTELMNRQMRKDALSSIHRARLEALIDEATVDCNNEDEELTELLTMIEERVVCPFRAKVMGETIEFTQFTWPRTGDGLFVVFRRKGKVHHVRLDSLQLIKPLPEGFEWIAAYRAWRKRNM